MVLVTSKTLEKKLRKAIAEIGIQKKNIILIPDGETAKEWDEVKKLLQHFIRLGMDRKSIVLALGGGSVGDIAGFASSIYLRGIPYIQIPTTLLAQVDSAHGGKTGINFLGYKNQVGSFHAARAVIIEPKILKSLSREQVIDGLGEILKAGLIYDPSILALLRKETLSTLLSSPRLKMLIEKTIGVKDHHVAKDFKDTGLRQILNFGHTFGHAVELKYKLSHGRAVLIGMLQELTLAEKMGLTPPAVQKELLDVLEHLGIRLEKKYKPDIRTLLRDKKISGKYIYLPVIEKVGKARLVKMGIKNPHIIGA